MTQRFGKRATKIEGQFAPRLIDMLRSPAWCALSLSGHRVLDRIEIELADHGGKDNGSLPVTFDDFNRYGIHRHAIAPAIRELVALGFLEVTEQGSAGNREFRQPNRFRLTYRATQYAGPTDEWRRFKTDADAIAAKPARARKQNSSDGKRQVSVTETGTETAQTPVPETVTTAPVPETITTLDIPGGRARGHQHQDARERAPKGERSARGTGNKKKATPAVEAAP